MVYEALILGNGQLSLDVAQKVRAPTLALAAGSGPPFMRETAAALAQAVLDGRAMVLEGATHDLVPKCSTSSYLGDTRRESATPSAR